MTLPLCSLYNLRSSAILKMSLFTNLTCCKPEDADTEEKEVLLPKKRDRSFLPANGQPNYESLDYDKYPNVPYMEKMHSLTTRARVSLNVFRWVTVAGIGFLTGLIMLSCTSMI